MKMNHVKNDVLPAISKFAQDFIAAGVVEVALGADHIQSPPRIKKYPNKTNFTSPKY
jgi:hypothetical protein